MSDEVTAIANRCLAGDENAMLELVERFRCQVFRLCYRIVGHQQDAEDMTQEAFARALRSLSSWDQSRAFMPWLFAIAGNRCRTLLSNKARRPKTSTLVDQWPDKTADEQGVRQLTEEVQLAVGELRAEYRDAFLLFHQQELSYAEIAEALDCPVGTVKTWVHRARQELIKHLSQRQVICGART